MSSSSELRKIFSEVLTVKKQIASLDKEIKLHKQQKPNRITRITRPLDLKQWITKKNSLELKQSKLVDKLYLLNIHQKNTIAILNSKKKSS